MKKLSVLLLLISVLSPAAVAMDNNKRKNESADKKFNKKFKIDEKSKFNNDINKLNELMTNLTSDLDTYIYYEMVDLSSNLLSDELNKNESVSIENLMVDGKIINLTKHNSIFSFMYIFSDGYLQQANSFIFDGYKIKNDDLDIFLDFIDDNKIKVLSLTINAFNGSGTNGIMKIFKKIEKGALNHLEELILNDFLGNESYNLPTLLIQEIKKKGLRMKAIELPLWGKSQKSVGLYTIFNEYLRSDLGKDLKAVDFDYRYDSEDKDFDTLMDSLMDAYKNHGTMLESITVNTIRGKNFESFKNAVFSGCFKNLDTFVAYADEFEEKDNEALLDDLDKLVTEAQERGFLPKNFRPNWVRIHE